MAWSRNCNFFLQKSSRRVGVKFDISAPQVILPKDLSDPHTSIVVFDLGKLKVTNSKSEDEEEISLNEPTTPPDGPENDGDDVEGMTDLQQSSLQWPTQLKKHE